MSKFKDFIGIDISKDIFDVMDSSENHYQFHNDLTGFKEFGKILSTRSFPFNRPCCISSNMVCDRCKRDVKEELGNIGLSIQ